MNNCQGKRPYVSKADAEKEIARLAPKPRMKAYRCGNHWHIGRKQQAKKKSRDERQGEWLLSRGKWTSEGRPR